MDSSQQNGMFSRTGAATVDLKSNAAGSAVVDITQLGMNGASTPAADAPAPAQTDEASTTTSPKKTNSAKKPAAAGKKSESAAPAAATESAKPDNAAVSLEPSEGKEKKEKKAKSEFI